MTAPSAASHADEDEAEAQHADAHHRQVPADALGLVVGGASLPPR